MNMFVFILESAPGRTPVCIKDLKNFCANKFIFPEKTYDRIGPNLSTLNFTKPGFPPAIF